MVKTFVAALVCGTFFVAHLSAQEVFIGNQKAKPKYPKAEPAKAVATVPSKPAGTSAHSVAPAQKPDNNAAKKVAAATSAKPKPAARDGGSYNASDVSNSAKPATITKATPTVMPGQRAPAATPSPIVRPQPPLIAKAPPAKTSSASSTANPKVPPAAVPPPTKVAQSATKAASKPSAVETYAQAKAEALAASKAVAKEINAADSHPKVAAASQAAKTGKLEVKTSSTTKASTKEVGSTEFESPAAPSPALRRPTVAKAATAEIKAAGPSNSRLAAAPPAEGPKHDVVRQVKKSSTAPAKSSKAPAVARTITPATKPKEDTEEEEATMATSASAKPAIAPATTAVAKKSTAPKQTVDARSIAAVPVSLQTRRDAPSTVTRAGFVSSTPAETVIPSPASDHFETAFTKLADGFDYPVGRPDAQGYYRARGFRSHGHLGEDWDGVGGGNTDLGDPIYSIGDGLVVFARDCHMGWGNVVIVRHSYREGGAIRTVDSLYGHLDTILVRNGQAVARGQKIATMGTAHGLYDAHLHLEIRKNIEIGMSRAAFAQDFSNYYDPSQFIAAHRHLQNSTGNYRVAMNTFTHDSRIRWDKVHNYSHAHTGGGTSESSAALKRALAAKNE